MQNLIKMPELCIGNLRINKPIIQGGMGVGISLSGLASAVANQGGVGVIATVGIGVIEPDIKTNYRKANIRALRKEIRRARQRTEGVIGVNIMVALSDYKELLLASVDEGADIIFMGAGLPLKVPQILTPERINEESVRIVPIVSSGRATEIILRSWSKNGCFPSAIVVEGPEAGGHLGFKKCQIEDPEFSLEKILPDVNEVVFKYEQQYGKSIPVIAAGGIYTGADIYAFLNNGTSGVQMATRFVPTLECDADQKFKQVYIDADRDDMIIIDSPVGLPGRAVRNRFLSDVSSGKKKPFVCGWKCLRTCDYKNVTYCIADALVNAKNGELSRGFVFGGANAYRAKTMTTVKEVFDSLAKEYTAASCRIASAVS